MSSSNYLSLASAPPSRPSPIAGPSSAAPVNSSSAAQKPDRLYVGNLSPTIDEYALIQIFSRFGKIAKLDFLFHKTGPLKGKPRGFAFVEFTSKDDALKALLKLNDKPLRGRKLVVTYASQTAHPEQSQTHTRSGRGRFNEPPRTTTLSLIKNQRRPQSAAAQIAALEAKLSAMQNSPLAAVGAPVSAPGSASGSAGPSRLGSVDAGEEERAERAVTDPEDVEEMQGEDAMDVEMEIEKLKREVEEDLERAGMGGVGSDSEADAGKGKGKQKQEVVPTGDQMVATSPPASNRGQADKPTSTGSTPAPSRLPPRPVGLPPKPSAAVLQQSHTSGAPR